MTSVAASAADVPRPKSWTVGAVTISRIIEGTTLFDIPALFPKATREDLDALSWLKPHFISADGRGILSVHALVVDTPTKRIIVDTCVGNDKERGSWLHYANLQTSFLTDLDNAGFPRESFDVVLCTHMHVDHVGWNTMLVDGEWVPTFPNARYLLSKTEFEFWSDRSQHADLGGFDEVQRLTFVDSLQPVLNAGLVDLVEEDHRVCDEVVLISTPGHSPGHVSVNISSCGEQAMITGDMAHHPCQLAHPDWGISNIDFNCDQAAETRRRIFSEVADNPVLVIGTHWAGETAGMVKRSGEAYRLECRR